MIPLKNSPPKITTTGTSSPVLALHSSNHIYPASAFWRKNSIMRKNKRVNYRLRCVEKLPARANWSSNAKSSLMAWVGVILKEEYAHRGHQLLEITEFSMAQLNLYLHSLYSGVKTLLWERTKELITLGRCVEKLPAWANEQRYAKRSLQACRR